MIIYLNLLAWAIGWVVIIISLALLVLSAFRLDLYHSDGNEGGYDSIVAGFLGFGIIWVKDGCRRQRILDHIKGTRARRWFFYRPSWTYALMDRLRKS